MFLRGLAPAFAIVAALALDAPDVLAFCRSSTGCDPSNQVEGKVCSPEGADDCGNPLEWKQPCVGFDVQKDGSSQVDYDTADNILAEAFNTWLVVDCGGGAGPSIAVTDLGPTSCGHNEYNEHGGNANELIFQDTAWPHKDVLDGNQDIALTTVTYDTHTGEIFDADIEVNSADWTLTTTDDGVDTDLLSVLTHEVGHFFGLGHAQPEFMGATMQPSYQQGSITLRDLTPDDINAMCTAYPPDRSTTGKCDFVPRHGFSSVCLSDQTDGKCSYSPGSTTAFAGAPFGLFLFSIAIARARSGSRRRSRSR